MALPRMRIAGLGLLGGGLGAALGLAAACTSEVDPRTCSDDVVGPPSRWQAEVPQDVPACAEPPAEPTIGVCVRHEDRGSDSLDLDVRLEAEIVEIGSGKPPVACNLVNTSGAWIDADGELTVPPEDVRWIRLDASGERWVIAMAAPGNTAPLLVGEPVTAWIRWDRDAVYGSYTLDLRDPDGRVLWWYADERVLVPVVRSPDCWPLRLGPAVCTTLATCSRQQHHAVVVDRTVVGPGEQAVVGGMRFTHGTTWLGYDATCEDAPHAGRTMAATLEDR